MERKLRKKRERARPVSCLAGGERVRVRGGGENTRKKCYLLLSATPPPWHYAIKIHHHNPELGGIVAAWLSKTGSGSRGEHADRIKAVMPFPSR